MSKVNILSLLEKINKTLETKNSCRHFSQLTLEFAELFYVHWNLLDRLRNICNPLIDIHLLEESNKMKATLEHNLEKIIKIIEITSNRKIYIYTVESGDSVWEIAKTLKSNVAEIYELNNLKKIFSLEDKKFLLIPIET